MGSCNCFSFSFLLYIFLFLKKNFFLLFIFCSHLRYLRKKIKDNTLVHNSVKNSDYIYFLPVLLMDRSEILFSHVYHWPCSYAKKESWVQSLGGEDPLEDCMATHSSILAWRNPWTEEPSGLQSMGWQRVRQTERLTLSHFSHECVNISGNEGDFWNKN